MRSKKKLCDFEQIETFDLLFSVPCGFEGQKMMRQRSRLMNSSRMVRPAPELVVMTSAS